MIIDMASMLWLILVLVSLWTALLTSVVMVLMLRRQRAYRFFLSEALARPMHNAHPLEVYELPTLPHQHQPIALMIRSDEMVGSGDLRRGPQAAG